VVNTPNYTHYDFAKQALNAGKHILIEKPMTVTKSEAKELFALADSKNLKLLVYQNRRYDSDFLSLQQALQSFDFGNPVELHIRFDRYRYNIGAKVGKETKVPGAGIAYDLGPHLIDSAIALFGLPKEYKVTKGYHRPSTVVDDYVQIQLSYPNQLQVYLTASMLVSNPQPAFVFHGTKGSFVKDRTDVQEEQLIDGIAPNLAGYGLEPHEDKAQILLVKENGEQIEPKMATPKGDYSRIFEDVYQTLVYDKPYPIKREEVLKQIEILEFGS
jgi:predicted dehydrogenase